MTRHVSFITLGCAKNEVDTAHMTDLLRSAHYEITDDPLSADVVIVNTCAFIQAATEESIDAVLEAAGYDNVASGKAHLVVAGCMPARYQADLKPEIPEASRFVPCSDEENIASIIGSLFDGPDDGDARADCPDHPEQAPSPVPPYAGAATPSGDGLSAYVKISDGCDRFCSYCAIPFIRGRYHSFPYDDISREVNRQIDAGAREIVLIAQDTGRWGQDFDNPKTLAWLLEALAQSHRDTWLRVMYIQPEGLTPELLDVVARNGNICPYFDIPFQHCDESVLKRMNRTGSGADYIDLARRIRARIPHATLRTTLIAGFPGETDEQFEKLCDFVDELSFDYVGVFPYSREEGTRAFALDDQIDEDEKLSRAQELRDRADAVSGSVVAGRVGQTMSVLVCGTEEDGQLFGRAMCQAPDVDGVTYLDKGRPGEFVEAVIADTLLYEMEGEVTA